MNSQRPTAPGDELAERFHDVGLRRDRIGADHLGAAQRHRLGDRARAFKLLEHGRAPDKRRSPPRRSPAATLPENFSLIAAPTESSEIRPDKAAKAPSSTAFGIGRPTCFMASSVAGTARALNLPTKSCRPSSAKLRAVLIRMIAAGPQAGEHVDLVQQRRVLDDERVGLEDRLADADLLVIDPAERDDGRAGALRAEARERLGVLPLAERGDREHLRGGHYALAAAPVDAYLEHARQYRGVGWSAFDLGQLG